MDWFEKRQDKGIYKGGFEKLIPLYLLGIKNVLKKRECSTEVKDNLKVKEVSLRGRR